MQLNPNKAWQSVCVISGGDTSHHASPTIMRMRLPNGELVRTDAENASVFVLHCDRLFNNCIPIYWTVLYIINQIDVMKELDTPIPWDEKSKTTTKLANYKAPGLNGVPPNAFKALNDENITWILLFYNQLWCRQADLY